MIDYLSKGISGLLVRLCLISCILLYWHATDPQALNAAAVADELQKPKNISPIHSRYDQSLHHALQGADRINIDVFGAIAIGDESTSRPMTMFTTQAVETNTLEIKSLLDHLEVEDPRGPESHIAGIPEISLTFFQGERQLTTVSLYGGEILGLSEWPSDAYLVPESRQFLYQWLLKHGIKASPPDLSPPFYPPTLGQILTDRYMITAYVASILLLYILSRLRSRKRSGGTSS